MKIERVKKPMKKNAPKKASQDANGAKKKPKKAATPVKTKAAPVKRQGGMREGSMIARIFELMCKATERKPISKGRLFDILKDEFVPPRKDSDVTMWIGYAKGYLGQAGHTVNSVGKGPGRAFWAEADTHKPYGRFAPKPKE